MASPEDQEYYNCQQEMSEDLYQQYCQIERIVSKLCVNRFLLNYT